MVPAICIQDHKLKNGSKNFYSYLSEDRKMRKGEKEYKVKLSLGKKIIREISRIKKDIFTKKDKKPTVTIFFK